MSAVQQVATVAVLTKPQMEAAELLADDRLSDNEIATQVGIERTTLWRWKRNPEFAKQVRKFVDDFEKCLLLTGIARRRKRIDALNDRWNRMVTVIEERAADPTMKDVPGGKTGLLVRQVKGIGAKEDFQLVEVYAVDTGLLKELREHEKQAAVEVGEWVERTALTDPSGQYEFGSLSAVERAERVARILESGRKRRAGQLTDGAGEVGASAGTADGGGEE